MWSVSGLGQQTTDVVGFWVGAADYRCGRILGWGSRLQMWSVSGLGQQLYRCGRIQGWGNRPNYCGRSLSWAADYTAVAGALVVAADYRRRRSQG